MIKEMHYELEVPWINSQKAFQRTDQHQHFQHRQSAAHRIWCQSLLCPCLSPQVGNLGQVHGILQELQAFPRRMIMTVKVIFICHVLAEF